MTVLILGGCGFIGKHVLDVLADDRIPMVVFDVHADPEQSSKDCIFVKAQFSELTKLESIFEHHCITHVIHLISTTLPKSSNEDKSYDLSSNVIQTLHVLDLCVKYQVQKILFMSSGGTIYGSPKHLPVDESHPNNPISSYGIGKLAIEKYLFLYHHLYGLNYVALRAANPYGPGQNPLTGQGIIANFIHKLHMQQPLEVWGDGSNVRDYFYAGDLANLTKLAVFSQENGVFNAGSGVGITINQMIGTLTKIINKQSNVIYKEQRGVDVPAVVLNCAAAREKFGWCALTSLEIGIENYVGWYLTNYKKLFHG